MKVKNGTVIALPMVSYGCSMSARNVDMVLYHNVDECITSVLLTSHF
jgi:uncharacterized protein YgiB involved in biofilm formation